MSWLFNDNPKPTDVVEPETLDERIERLQAALREAERTARLIEKELNEALLFKAETPHVTRFDQIAKRRPGRVQ